jgi:NAD(P)-dependent dehydrogenase (short-subunit alcohol dehydrogenase family)
MSTALIIGASGGIGSALAGQLKDNYDLFLVGRDTSKLKRLSDSSGGRAIPTDVASELEVQALMDDLPKLDLIVYSAGDIQPEPLKIASSDHWHRVLDANLTGLFFTLKHCDAKLNKGSRIYVLGARPELITYRSFGIYAAAKAGAASLVKIAAIEMKRKASLTLVLPKAVDTPFWENVGKPPADALAASDVANAIVGSLQEDPQEELLVG